MPTSSMTRPPAEAHTLRSTDRRAGSPGAAEAKRSKPTIEQLKARDNHTNIVHLAHVYLVILATIAGALWSYQLVAEAGLGWWWNIPATAVAILLMGASQHQLGGATHEGTHYTLFKNRVASEAVSDWLCAFPLYTTTHAFRLHHLAHHQFVNDPERDPNFDQAKESGHWLDFPIEHVDFLIAILKQLNPVRLVSYILARVRYSALGVETNPYAIKDGMGSPWVIRSAVLFAVGAPAVVLALVVYDLHAVAGAVLVTMLAAVVGFYIVADDTAFPKSRITPVISARTTQISRIVYLGLLYGALTALDYATGAPAWGYFLLLWVLPLFTTFPLFMILREWLQHGNADRGRYTNSRVFLVNPLLRYAVFPWGMDYHLPHHLVASVPHYKLRDLHAFLLDDPKYAAQCRVVEGWSQPGEQGLPTIIDVLGPRYTPQGNPIHVDDATLELADVNDEAGIAAHSEASRRG